MKPSELLAKPESWCVTAMARNADGNARSPDDPDACRWCVAGAIFKCYRGNDTARKEAMEAIAAKLPKDAPLYAVHEWERNPARTHAEILALVEEANL